MAAHEIAVNVPPKLVLNSDVTFDVWSDGEKLGQLQVSKGSVDWVPGRAKTRYRLRWERFDELMREHGRQRRT